MDFRIWLCYYLYLGDIGHVDGDGYFFIMGRVKELIKYKGFQVYDELINRPVKQ